jgi:hypothetical protein
MEILIKNGSSIPLRKKMKELTESYKSTDQSIVKGTVKKTPTIWVIVTNTILGTLLMKVYFYWKIFSIYALPLPTIFPHEVQLHWTAYVFKIPMYMKKEDMIRILIKVFYFYGEKNE